MRSKKELVRLAELTRSLIKKTKTNPPLQEPQRIDFCQRFQDDNLIVFIFDESCFQISAN